MGPLTYRNPQVAPGGHQVTQRVGDVIADGALIIGVHFQNVLGPVGIMLRVGTADRPVLLWRGAETVLPTLRSGDVQFLENCKFAFNEICAAFGVP